MAKGNYSSRIARQIVLYDYVITGGVFGPDDIVKALGIPRRTLQRDLIDLRDCGLIDLKYKKTGKRYEKKECKLDESAEGRHRSHLLRLYRLGTLVHKLSKTSSEDLDKYEMAMREYNEFVEDSKEDPDITEEDIADYKYFIFLHVPDISDILYDLKKEYYELFPDSCERTRQRDFAELRNAGFEIYYSQIYHSYIFMYDNRID